MERCCGRSITNAMTILLRALDEEKTPNPNGDVLNRLLNLTTVTKVGTSSVIAHMLLVFRWIVQQCAFKDAWTIIIISFGVCRK